MKVKSFVPDIQKILVLPDKNYQEKTRAGIIIPSMTKEGKPMSGTVVETGSGEADLPMRYRKGDRVLFSTYAGIDLEFEYQNYEGNTFKIMNQMDIMGKFEEEK